MGKTKKDTNARVAGRRKQTKESAAEKLCMDFRTGPQIFLWSMFTYNLIELHRITPNTKHAWLSEQY